MENLNRCPLCGGEDMSRPLLSAPDHMLTTGNYTVVRCLSCELLYTNPRPHEKDLGAFYQSEKYISHTERKKNLREKIYFKVQSLMLARKASLINKLEKNQQRLLDVGCGTGAFAKHMQDIGYQVVAVEPQGAAREKANEKGLQVYENQEEIQKSHHLGLDVITLWHVLEHHARFKESLQLYYEMLAPGGWLVVAVPQYLSFDARFYKSWWAAWDLPRHLFHFSEKTLKLAASQTGFELKAVKGMPFDAFYVSLLSEQYRQTPMGPLRAIIIGAFSNLLAFFRIKPWSSQIFVFRKTVEK
ncbi:MAG: class I SAM-dependent methyltransferase [Bacteroidales bacterium]|nr:class I SAM-dependent methyltransferase [Bacteroidales bacterium]